MAEEPSKYHKICNEHVVLSPIPELFHSIGGYFTRLGVVSDTDHSVNRQGGRVCTRLAARESECLEGSDPNTRFTLEIIQFLIIFNNTFIKRLSLEK